ncbi:MAG: apolipoprotein N-acyltransferase [Candidatus Cloacimonetes bacterium 4572_65]|nr:MAG: apolipoprotein N-acyltransferase [Candidatus Cloacimonetes bacterium 4572_65]
MNKKKLTLLIYVVISALVIGLSRYPRGLGIIAFMGFIPLFRFFDSAKHDKLFLLKASMLFSVIYNGVACYWIGYVSIPGLIGLFFLFGLYFWVIFLYLNTIWRERGIVKWLGFIAIWITFEFFLFHTELRFPWLNLGYALGEFNYLLQIADIGGIYLLSILILISNILLYKILAGDRKSIIVALALFTVWGGYGYLRFNSIKMEKQNLKVKMMQPSVGIDKFNVPIEELLTRYEKLLYYASLEDVDLHIWPEAAIPDRILHPQYGYMREILKNLARKNKLSIFFGCTDSSPAPEGHKYHDYYYNAATLLHYPELTFDEPYYKMLLVPVGERMPYLEYFPFLWNLEFGQANWEFGKEQKIFKTKDKQGKEYSFSTLICYEMLFPMLSNDIARSDVDFIVNLTNDVWFGESVGTYQHALVTRIRAIETRKPILRCANTGHSMVVSPNGKIEVFSKMMAIGNFDAPIYTTKSSSLFVKYFSNLPFLFVFSTLFIFLLAKFKSKKVN